MKDTPKNRAHFGLHDDYAWLVSDATLGELLDVCPEFVMKKYVAITSFDSGPLSLNDVEFSSGWETRGGIAYSPVVENTRILPYDNCFDEWYVFEKPTDLGSRSPQESNVFEASLDPGEVHPFVNFSYSFSLHRPESATLTELFWKQMDWIRPYAFIADGEQLTVVSCDKELLAQAREGLAAQFDE